MNSFLKRSLTGIVFVGIIITSILASWWTWGLLLFILLIGINFEISMLLRKIGYRFSYAVNLLSSILIFGGTYSIFILGEIKLSALLIMLAGIILDLLFHWIKTSKITTGILSSISAVYSALPLAMSTGLLWTSYVSPVSNGFTLFPGLYYPVLLLGLFILIWTFDSFAYITGSLAGKHKMAPGISPNKTWEGFFGGILFSGLAALILPRLLGMLSFGEWFGMVIIVAVFGTAGDLIESQIKRMAKVKDSGNIMPGHGGLLDRFDSFLMIVPFALTYIVFLASF